MVGGEGGVLAERVVGRPEILHPPLHFRLFASVLAICAYLRIHVREHPWRYVLALVFPVSSFVPAIPYFPATEPLSAVASAFDLNLDTRSPGDVEERGECLYGVACRERLRTVAVTSREGRVGELHESIVWRKLIELLP